MTPDRSHVHHKLIDMGLSQKQAVGTLYVISAILGLSAVVLTTSGALKAMLVLIALAVAAFICWKVIVSPRTEKADEGIDSGSQKEDDDHHE